MRKLLSTFALTLLTAASTWAYDFKAGDLYYNITDEAAKTVEVTYEEWNSNYSSLPGAITIPETVSYNGTTYSVTSIGDYAFLYCSALTQVNIPGSVTSIGGGAFAGCSALTQVTIPNSVTSIGDEAFFICSALAQVTIPDGVTSIGNQAFSGCSALTQVNIGNGVTSIGDMAFAYCSALTQVNIPNNVESIGDRAFYECSALTAINVESGNTTYCSVDGILFNKNKTTLIQYPASKTGTTYAIPESVTSIGSSAFYNCSALTQVNIPESVTSIRDEAFRYCSALTQVTLPNSVESIGRWAFHGSALTQVNIPGSVTSIGDEAFRGSALTAINVESGNTTYCSVDGILFNKDKTKLIQYPAGKSETTYNIPESVTSIGSWAFSYSYALTEITIPNSVTSIGNKAFRYCSALTQVTWNAINCEDFNSSDYSPFYDSRSNITNFTFGNQVEHIPAYLCYGMDKLTQVTLPENVESIGGSAFKECSALAEMTVKTLVPPALGSDVFPYGSNNTVVNVPIGTLADYQATEGWKDFNLQEWTFTFTVDNLNYIVTDATQNTVELTGYEATPTGTLEIPATVTYNNTEYSVKSIGDGVFKSCSAITQVTWNIINYADFKSSDSSPFYNIRSNITTFTFGDQVEHIPAYLCYGMSALTSIIISDNVTSIGAGAFSGSGVVSLAIPAKATDIGADAFMDCNKLATVFYRGNMAEWCNISFENNYANPLSCALKTVNLHIDNKVIKELTIPEGITAISDYCFYNAAFLTRLDISSSITNIGESAFAGCTALGSIYCRASVPPTIMPSTFDGVDRSIPLYIPEGKIMDYMFAPYWNEFTNLHTMPATNLQTPSMPESIRIEGGMLHNPQGLPVRIYDMQGRMVYSGTAGTVSQPTGVYVVLCAGASSKVLF